MVPAPAEEAWSGGVPARILAEVAGGASTDSGGTDAALLGDFLPVLCAAVEERARLTPAQSQTYAVHGGEAARRGVALRAILDLYLSAGWRLWRHLPPVLDPGADPAAVVTAGEVMLRGVDDAVAALAEGYQLARRSMIREQEAARREFFDDLLSGRAGVAGLLNRASAFGIDLTGPHAVIVIEAEKRFTDGSSVTSRLERAVQGSKGDAEALIASKDGELVVIFAAPDRAAVEHVIGRLSTALEPDTRPRAGDDPAGRLNVGRWRIGVGRTGAGPSGLLASFEDARSALELSRRLRITTPVVEAADLLVYQMLMRDRSAITDLVRSLLAPLHRARGGAKPLLETLEAYFDAGGNTAEAARQLHLSVRAVSYRLERVRELTGYNPDRSGERFALHTAVLGAKLLDWPEQPLDDRP